MCCKTTHQNESKSCGCKGHGHQNHGNKCGMNFLSKKKKIEFYEKKAKMLQEKIDDINEYINELKA